MIRSCGLIDPTGVRVLVNDDRVPEAVCRWCVRTSCCRSRARSVIRRRVTAQPIASSGWRTLVTHIAVAIMAWRRMRTIMCRARLVLVCHSVSQSSCVEIVVSQWSKLSCPFNFCPMMPREISRTMISTLLRQCCMVQVAKHLFQVSLIGPRSEEMPR